MLFQNVMQLKSDPFVLPELYVWEFVTEI